MSRITVICSTIAGASLTLAAFCVAFWRKQQRSRKCFMYLGTAVAAAAIWVFLASHLSSFVWGVMGVPLFFGLICTPILLTIGYRLGRGMPRTGGVERESEVREKLFDLTADFPNLCMCEWDLHTHEIRVPQRWRAELGLRAVGGITLEQLISRCHANDRHRVERVVNGAIKNARDCDVEFRVLRRDGSVRWVYAFAHVQVDELAKPKRLTAICIDITQRKEAEILGRNQRDRRQKVTEHRTAFLERQIAESARVEREVIESCTRQQKRIAYDLHDGVGQQLVSIALSAKLLEEELRPDHAEAAAKASAIVKLANETTRQARLTARGLEGTAIGDLKGALESLASNIRQNCRVKSIVKSNTADLPISAPVAAQLYRITQEAVRNAVEHGAAREVLIQLTVSDHDLLLTVQDDGRGFEVKATGHHMGLRIMRYRAHCIGGSCEVHSGRDRGTVVCCRIPLEKQPSLSTIS